MGKNESAPAGGEAAKWAREIVPACDVDDIAVVARAPAGADAVNSIVDEAAEESMIGICLCTSGCAHGVSHKQQQVAPLRRLQSG